MGTWSFDRADVIRVIDADNVELAVTYDVDLGFRDRQIITRPRSFRILGTNAREVNQPGGLEAISNLMGLLPVGLRVRLDSVKDDKYGGRFLARITLPDGRDLATTLITGQWAAEWNGRGPKPVPPWPRTIEG